MAERFSPPGWSQTERTIAMRRSRGRRPGRRRMKARRTKLKKSSGRTARMSPGRGGFRLS